MMLVRIAVDIDAQNAKKKQTIDPVLNAKASRRGIIKNIKSNMGHLVVNSVCLTNLKFFQNQTFQMVVGDICKWTWITTDLGITFEKIKAFKYHISIKHVFY